MQWVTMDDRTHTPEGLDHRRRPRCRWRTAGAGLVIVAATLAAYVPALRSGYIWDDDQYLTENPLVQTPAGLRAIWELHYDGDARRLRIHTPQYYPLVYSSFWVEYRLWGLAPFGYHLVNVLLHALSALLVWRIGRRVGIPAPWFVAAVFALHPVQVESVAWITERKNVLSGVFYLLALAALLRFLEGRQAGAWWYVAGLVCFCAALLSKTVTCSLPVVLVLLLVYRRRRVGWRVWAALTPLFVVGVCAGLLTAYLERTHVGAGGAEFSLPLWQRTLLVAPRAFLFYAGKIAWPHPLIFIYPRWQIDPETWTAYLPLAGCVLVAAVAWLGRRRWGWGPLLLLAFSAVTLAPALGFFNVYPHRFSWVADHFQYLGCLGFIVLYTSAAAWLLRAWARHRAAARVCRRVAGAVVLVALGVRSHDHARSFADARRLWEDTLAANPHAWIASLNLGILASREGDYARAAEYFEQTARTPGARAEAYSSWGTALQRIHRTEGAVVKYREAIEADPLRSKGWGELGAALARLGHLDEAISALRKATQLEPDWITPWLNLGAIYASPARFDPSEAERCLRRAISISPLAVEPRLVYADLLGKLGRWAEAVRQYRTIERERPDAFRAGGRLAEALVRCGQWREALRRCRAGLETDPTNLRYAHTLARILATCPDAALRDGREAVTLARRLARQRPRDPLVLDTLACAYAELGEYDRAMRAAERAIEIARKRGDAALAARLQKHLDRFAARQPWHGETP